MELIEENGFDDVAVSDIVKRVGVAQGTFYYHFESKEAMLDALIDRFSDTLAEAMDRIWERRDLNAVDKFVEFSKVGMELRRNNNLISFVHEERNAALHNRVATKYAPRYTSYLVRLVEEGIEQGIFHTRYPLEAAIAVFQIGQVPEQLILYNGGIKDTKRLLDALQDLWERVLVAEPGTLGPIFELWGSWL